MQELLITIVNQPVDVTLINLSKQFMHIGGAIGRDEQSDLILNDTTKTISKTHALIHFRDDHYYITDVSTNGVFLNKDTMPLGKGNHHLIADGDQFRMGEYVLRANFVALGQTVKSERNKNPSNTLTFDDDIDRLLTNDQDISDLLIETPKQASYEHFADEKTIDDILQSISHTEEFIDIDALQTSDEAELARLLGTEEVDAFDLPDAPIVIPEAPTFEHLPLSIEEYEQYCRDELHLTDHFYTSENLAAFFTHVKKLMPF